VRSIPDIGRIEIPKCSGLAAPCVLSFGVAEQAGRQRPPRFRTIQVWPKDLPATLQQVES
jgi:hypothetical protein